MSIKKTDFDNYLRYRARLEGKDFTQKAGVYQYETFFSVVRRSTSRLIFALSIHSHLDSTNLEVTTGFLITF